MIKYLSIVGWILCIFFVSCTSTSPSKTAPPLLQKAKGLYTEISNQRGNPQDDLVKNDWQPWYYEAPERLYLYSTPYVPFFLYDGGLVYLREVALFPTWGFLYGGTKYQDEADRYVIQHAVNYTKMFETIWPNHRKHTNYVNMDTHTNKIESVISEEKKNK